MSNGQLGRTLLLLLTHLRGLFTYLSHFPTKPDLSETPLNGGDTSLQRACKFSNRACALGSSMLFQDRSFSSSRSRGPVRARAPSGCACAEGRGPSVLRRLSACALRVSGPLGLRERNREDGGCGGECSEAVSGLFFFSLFFFLNLSCTRNFVKGLGVEREVREEKR